MSLQACCTHYAIDISSPFGQALQKIALAEGSAALFTELIDQLDAVFTASGLEERARIIRHVLTLTDLPEPVRQQAHVVFYRTAGSPGDLDRNPVWNQLSERERRMVGSWVKRARIGSHCFREPAKAALYLRYADVLQKVEYWDEHTLLLHFGDFVIADDDRFPEQALFYAGATPSPHPTGLANPDRSLSPGNPAIAHRRTEESLRAGQVDGIIQLLFDSEGLKQSGALIDFALQNRPARGLLAPLRKIGRGKAL